MSASAADPHTVEVVEALEPEAEPVGVVFAVSAAGCAVLAVLLLGAALALALFGASG